MNWHSIPRRRLLRLAALVPIPAILAACGSPDKKTPSTPTSTTARPPQATASQPASGAISPVAAAAQSATVAPSATAAAAAPVMTPTPACGPTDETVAQTEGPYFTRNSPERSSLREAGTKGTPLTVAGLVLDTRCRPVARALLDFWQADDSGEYDNRGYRYRGHLFTDADGRFSLETVVPGLYPGRTRHIHVKAQAPNGPVLTTQLYFPGEARNASDGIFNRALLLDVHDGAAGAKQARFTFAVRTA